MHRESTRYKSMHSARVIALATQAYTGKLPATTDEIASVFYWVKAQAPPCVAPLQPSVLSRAIKTTVDIEIANT